jgi:Bacterial SH3 domain
MKIRFFTILFFLTVAAAARAGTVGYAQCGTYDAYILLYKSTEKLEEVGKLHCGEKLEVLGSTAGFSQVRTVDGRIGWVRETDLTEVPPPPQKEFTFGFMEQPKPSQPAPTPKLPNGVLTNADVLYLSGKRHAAEFIVAKIKESRCAFDTSPKAIQQLQSTGLSDKVILAMLEAPVASATQVSSAESVEVKVADGTAIELELAGDVFSEELQDGMIVRMAAAEDLVVDGVPIIVRGSAARARVLAVKAPGSRGGGGEVAWFMQDITTTTGDRIPMIFAAKQPGKMHTQNFEGYPFFLTEFHNGSPAMKATNFHFRAVVHGDTILRVPQSLASNLPAKQEKAQTVQPVSQHKTAEAEATAPSQPQPAADPAAKPE